ncbi:MAG: hypothetical protein LBQ08_04300 [Holosporaceae bacterium]|jgi:hypothetical protein|nr:hypothetical protein [Holosporaceae bacterium]
MLKSENALIARICHDMITPLNAISLGFEAFETSGDKSLFNGIKESIDKANIILTFVRELYSEKSNTFCYSLKSLNQLVADFLEKYNISFELASGFENIPNIAGKIIMYNAVVAKEIMPFGGIVNAKIDDNSAEIVTVCLGKNVSIPNLNMDVELNSRNIMHVNLLQLLKESGFRIIAYQEESQVIIREQMIA